MDRLFVRANGETVSLQEVAKAIAKSMLQDPLAEYELTVGTDSQNFGHTKIVEGIVLHRKGRGGIFFYRVDAIRRISDLRQKIYKETQRSLALADNLLEALDQIEGFSLTDYHFRFTIHCDVGHNGKTNELIQEIVGWVHSVGYDCSIKPDSYAASTVANKYSK